MAIGVPLLLITCCRKFTSLGVSTAMAGGDIRVWISIATTLCHDIAVWHEATWDSMSTTHVIGNVFLAIFALVIWKNLLAAGGVSFEESGHVKMLGSSLKHATCATSSSTDAESSGPTVVLHSILCSFVVSVNTRAFSARVKPYAVIQGGVNL